MSGPGGGQPPHVQHREDEAFYVLEGDFEFLVEGRAIRAQAGSLFCVSKDSLHAHKNVGTKPGSMLVSQTPGGLHERYFEVLGEPATDKTWPPVPKVPPNTEKVVAIATEYGIEIPSFGR